MSDDYSKGDQVTVYPKGGGAGETKIVKRDDGTSLHFTDGSMVRKGRHVERKRP